MHIFENRARTIKLLTDKHANSPLHVLERMKKHLREHPLRASYEAWLVVDKDEWRDDQLRPLHSWAQEKENFGLALSNPKFEFWLLLHFEDGVGIASSQNCTQRLKKYVPDYKKGIDERKFTRERILRAIQRAKQRDNTPCADWPRSLGATTVYRLVEKLTQVILPRILETRRLSAGCVFQMHPCVAALLRFGWQHRHGSGGRL